VGLRRGGERVLVAGLSEGTRDQLYLALRLAYIEDYASRAEAPPFVGDDIFASFDPARTGHGLEALAAIGDRVQPILFTHHAHVVEAAQERLGEAADIIRIGAGRTPAIAA
jgi:chromosome segregation protein